MNAMLSEETLVEAVRTSTPALRARLLQEILKAGFGGEPPVLSPERERELQERAKDLNDSRPLSDYIRKLEDKASVS